MTKPTQVLNAVGDHSMATPKAFAPFDDLRPELDEMVGGNWSQLESVPSWGRCRLLAMRPGASVARLMSAHAVCMKVLYSTVLYLRTSIT